MQDNSNKEKSIQFIKLIASGEIDEAYDRFTSPAGEHHSPHFAPGFEALKTAMKKNHERFPEKQSIIKHVVGENDMVAVHSRVTLKPGDAGFAILHLFRFEEGRIVELWDFTQHG